MEIVAAAVAAHTFADEAAAAADAKEDNSFDFDLHDSVVAGAAYDVSFVVHRHHLPMVNLHRLYSQHSHLDTVAISHYSLSVLLIHHLTVSCYDVHCKNVDDYIF